MLTNHLRKVKMRRGRHREHIEDQRADMGRRGANSARGASSRRKAIQTTEVAPIRLFSMTEEENGEEEPQSRGGQRRVLQLSNSTSVGDSASSGSEGADVEAEDMGPEDQSPACDEIQVIQ